jgi:hypothetical protein
MMAADIARFSDDPVLVFVFPCWRGSRMLPSRRGGRDKIGGMN